MIITNKDGLTKEEKEKILKPYAKNSGVLHNPKDAAAASIAFLDENPRFLGEVGALLDRAQN